ncbi:MipA/OmpV family protein [Shewanella sp. VB17]|uniref:MipA/OmpV family protein n=1 Tax=Shewanella sp. VB17 TaxID=2739432 RepID=UPI0015630B64|nr:MipA/OmpV family protein [Shewanella sp. VB17]NRD72617.1 MipA/OmpV family protein [Shewanella sp. VB17]
MNRFKLVAFAYIFLPFFSWGHDAIPCENETKCIELSRWDIGLAFGYGERSNPLKDYDDMPIYLIPTFAYYGESWFFDNGNVGYTLAEEEQFTLNLTTSLSTDSAYFHRWDPSNIFIAGTNELQRNPATNLTRTFSRTVSPPVIGPLDKRRFTYLGGLEAFFYTRAGIINFSLAHDVLNVHQGTEAKVKWLYNLAVNNWNFELALRLDWKSENLVDYYYGVRESESLYWSRAYKAKSALNTGIELTSHYVMSQHWDLLFLARYTKIADEIAESPLLNEDYTSTFYIGTSYRF